LRLQTVALVVPDYDPAIRFYCDTLGFELLEDIVLSAEKRWVRVQPPGGGSALLLAKAASDDQRQAIGNQTGGRVFLFLEVDDFAGEYQRLLTEGVTFEERPRQEEYGSVAVFQDPFGNRWDLIGPAR